MLSRILRFQQKIISKGKIQGLSYNPEWGRFISMDDPGVLGASPEALTDKNLYIYCDNNPVMRVDEDGEFGHIVVGAAVGLFARYISDVAQNIAEKKSGLDVLKPSSSVVDYIAASASGALAATSVGVVGQFVGNMLISSTSYVLEQGASNKNVDTTELMFETVAGGVAGLIGGKGANGAKLYGVAKNAKLHLKTAVATHNIAHYSAQIRAVPDAIFNGFVKTNLANLSSYGITNWR